MRLPDNSDAACLIKADWLEDHGHADESQELREDVVEGPHIADVGTIGSGSDSFIGQVSDVGGISSYINSVGGSVGGIGGGISYYGIGGRGSHRIGGVDIAGAVVGGGSMDDVGGGVDFDRLRR